MGSLEGRSYLVTGAAAGIGAAVTESLRAARASVLAVDLEPAGDDSVGADLTVAGENARVVEDARERFGRLDGVVANAGVQHVAYVAAKHGVVGLVKTLALEGAEDGITASAVCPGYVRTRLVEGQIAAQAEATGIDESRVLD